jgi:hypothetical protein
MVARRGSPGAFPMRFVALVALVAVVAVVSMHYKGRVSPPPGDHKAHPSTLHRPRPYGIVGSGVD